ncbi:MAG: hypothetical protein Q4C34_02100 [Bacteroidales bacterium]|nr:hypothetical protein [Bacteroidales bacterium]
MTIFTEFQDSNIPEEGLCFFHTLANWVEEKKKGCKLIKWKTGQEKLKKLTCIRIKQNAIVDITLDMQAETLYVPARMGALFVIKQIRHAFCHNNIKYDDKTGEYIIMRTNKVKIAGRFTLDALKEFIHIYVKNCNTKN